MWGRTGTPCRLLGGVGKEGVRPGLRQAKPTPSVENLPYHDPRGPQRSLGLACCSPWGHNESDMT